jgi:hypothetical protein
VGYILTVARKDWCKVDISRFPLPEDLNQNQSLLALLYTSSSEVLEVHIGKRASGLLTGKLNSLTPNDL